MKQPKLPKILSRTESDPGLVYEGRKNRETILRHSVFLLKRSVNGMYEKRGQFGSFVKAGDNPVVERQASNVIDISTQRQLGGITAPAEPAIGHDDYLSGLQAAVEAAANESTAAITPLDKAA
ncbi:hypothetical protein IPO96_03565 [Candidatus Saccharibacteria bacterium]|jgi:hypothetical protein|nr:MAG: hypothetical protein IPO96_03565 [Candidatus Saccharibacteria bacterium]